MQILKKVIRKAFKQPIMPDFNVDSVRPAYDQCNHIHLNHFEQVLHSRITNNLSST